MRHPGLYGRPGLDAAFAEFYSHFKLAIAQGAGANDLGQMSGGAVVILDFDFTGLSDGEGFAEEERDPAEGEVARHDVEGGVGIGAVEDREGGFALNGLAVFTATVAIDG